MKKYLYILFILALGLGTYNNASAYPEGFVINSERTLQQFFNANCQNKELSIDLHFDDNSYLTEESLLFLKAAISQNRLVELNLVLPAQNKEHFFEEYDYEVPDNEDALNLFIPLMSSLIHLNKFTVFYGNETAINAIIENLPTGSNLLSEISFKSCSLSDAQALRLAQQLPNFKKLQSIDLSGNNLTLRGAATLSSAFSKIPSLEEVSLKNNKNILDEQRYAQLAGSGNVRIKFVMDTYVKGKLFR